MREPALGVDEHAFFPGSKRRAALRPVQLLPENATVTGSAGGASSGTPPRGEARSAQPADPGKDVQPRHRLRVDGQAFALERHRERLPVRLQRRHRYASDQSTSRSTAMGRSQGRGSRPRPARALSERPGSDTPRLTTPLSPSRSAYDGRALSVWPLRDSWRRGDGVHELGPWSCLAVDNETPANLGVVLDLLGSPPRTGISNAIAGTGDPPDLFYRLTSSRSPCRRSVSGGTSAYA